MSEISSEEYDQPRFLLRVYLVLFIQCVIFCGFAVMFNLIEPMKSFIKRYYWFPIIFLCLFALVVILILFMASINQQYPVNLIFLLFLSIFGGMGVSLDAAYEEFKVIFATVSMSIGVACFITFLIFIMRLGIQKCCVYVLFATFLASIFMMACALVMHLLKLDLFENIFLILSLVTMTLVFCFMTHFVIRLFSTNINNWSSSNLLLFLWFPAYFALALFTFSNFFSSKK